MIVVLCKDPTILSLPQATEPSQSLHFSLQASRTNWALGGLLIVTENLLASISIIFQAHILKIYPARIIVSFVNCLLVAIIAVPVGFMAERELNTWILKPDVTLIAVIFSGPLCVAIFAPLSIALAAAMSVIFLREDLHLGSVVGSIILLLGFYTVSWGRANEEKSKDCGSDILGTSPNGITPMLQIHKDGQYVE